MERHEWVGPSNVRTLFSEQNHPNGDRSRIKDRAHKRARVGVLQSNALPEDGEVIRVALFDDVSFDINVLKTTVDQGVVLSHGRAEGVDRFPCLFAAYGEAVCGIMHWKDGRVFVTYPLSEGGQVIAEMDEKSPICDGVDATGDPDQGDVVDLDLNAAKQSASTMQSRSLHGEVPSVNSVIDIMVLYSAEAANAYGGDAGMRSMTMLHVGYANNVLINSGISARLRLVHYGPAPVHTQASSGAGELAWLASDQNVSALRTLHGADLVTEITTVSALAYCSGAFSIVNNYPSTFTHECGT